MMTRCLSDDRAAILLAEGGLLRPDAVAEPLHLRDAPLALEAVLRQDEADDHGRDHADHDDDDDDQQKRAHDARIYPARTLRGLVGVTADGAGLLGGGVRLL